MRDCISEILLKTLWNFFVGQGMKVAEILFYRSNFPHYFSPGEKTASFQMGSSSSTLDLNVLGIPAFDTLSSHCATSFSLGVLSSSLASVTVWMLRTPRCLEHQICMSDRLLDRPLFVCPARTPQTAHPKAEAIPSPVVSANIPC